MTKDIKAFPQLNVESCERDGHGDLIEPFTSSSGGMTLRDWFAGQALTGELSSQNSDFNWGDEEAFAERVFLIADAMLKARSRG